MTTTTTPTTPTTPTTEAPTARDHTLPARPAPLTLVLGGTGKTGRRVARLLEARGLPARIASRTGSPRFDWDEPATWPAVLAGVGAIYLAYYPDLAAPGAAEQIGALSRLAAGLGVQRIVLLSGRGEPQVEPAERAVRESGVPFTILRAAFFAQNFSEGFLADGVHAGQIAFPAGQVAEPFIDADDVAEVAVAALTGDGHAGITYELSGPRLVTFGEAAAEIARASGRPVDYLPVTDEDYREVLGQLMPAEVADFLGALFAYVLDGHNAHLSDGVERVLARPARDFRDYAASAAATGAWAPADR